ncbi:MAG: VanZ family protein [Candidatus Zixiibacteriota bacterium]|nr:MAG: VanZ family protein [candidate division Zixibacteria bacterium]
MIIAVSSIPHLRGPSIEIPGADKIVHGIEYGVFAFLIFRSFFNFSDNFSLRGTLACAATFIVIFAVFDEFYQRSVPGRQFDVSDMIADIIGALLVLLIIGMRKRRARRAAGRSGQTAL